MKLLANPEKSVKPSSLTCSNSRTRIGNLHIHYKDKKNIAAHELN
jgi:hypothetical protein